MCYLRFYVYGNNKIAQYRLSFSAAPYICDKKFWGEQIRLLPLHKYFISSNLI
jgi:hypothetical protein